MSTSPVNSADDPQKRPLEIVELASVATLICLTLFALQAIACRWWGQTGVEALGLLLVLGSVATTVVLATRVRAGTRLERGCRYGFALVATLALGVWSPGVAFACLLIAPPAVTLILPALLRQTGFEIQLQTLDHRPPVRSGSDAPPLPVATESASPAPAPPEVVMPEAAADALADAMDPDGDPEGAAEFDPWQAVQAQFGVDQTLVRNVTQWQDPDGNRCVVANFRCRFSTANETCIVHVPFWPVLDEKPAVFCRVASGPAASLKTTEEHPHGLRMEVRLNDPVSWPADDVIVEVVASVAGHEADLAA